MDQATEGDYEVETKRGKWRSKLDFIFACVASGIGLGNVWRFPYLCYINGGGAFLLPYVIFAVSAGFPIAFLEMSLGQYRSYGGIKAWAICPLMQGVGIASTILQFLVNVYYNVILAWTFYYIYSSFTSEVPWAGCDHEWNTEACFTGDENETELVTVSNDTNSNQEYNFTIELSNVNYTALGKTDPVTEFWENKVLGITDGIHNLGNIKWDLALCLLLTYIFIFVCIMRGIRRSRIVVYIIVCSAYALLITLLVKGLTLPGSLNGIKYYLLPNWQRLSDSRVWADAGTQVFFSYSLCNGVLMTLGSYNTFNHNCFRDATIFVGMNILTSFSAGFSIFSVLGFMAQNLGVSIVDVAESGPGLTFLAYPKALAQMPLAPLWSILFFTTILFLGFSTTLSNSEALVSSVSDVLRRFCKVDYLPSLVLFTFTTVCFLVGLSMVTNGGIYILQLCDFFIGVRLGILIGCLECIIIVYLYGLENFSRDVKS